MLLLPVFKRRESMKTDSLYLSEAMPIFYGASGCYDVYRKRNRWMAYVRGGGLKHYIGTYDTPEEASRVHSDEVVKFGLKRRTGRVLTPD